MFAAGAAGTVVAVVFVATLLYLLLGWLLPISRRTASIIAAGLGAAVYMFVWWTKNHEIVPTVHVGCIAGIVIFVWLTRPHRQAD